MKGMLISSVLVLVIGTSGLFFLKRPDGQPWLSVSDFVPETTSIPTLLEATSKGEIQVYRWQDKNGHWHLSDQPPAGEPFDTVNVDPNTNLIQGVSSEPDAQDEDPQKSVSAPIPSPLTISPGKVQKLIEDAKNVQELANERERQLQQY